ncbi:MAG TPA: nickel-dependent lactate racemase [Gemmatimonadales bacterium]|nr:nickel-dependent lactate racemase [Gemmatimonadales bacterium]
MRLDFPYPNYRGIAPFEVPDRNLMGVFTPATFDTDESKVLAEGLANPHGAPRLRDAVRSEDRVLILIDDATRATPTARVLPPVLAELRAAGVPDDRIEFIEAPGSHRPMTEDELRGKMGDAYGRFRVHQHRWLDHDQLHDFGTTRDGTRITANKLLTEFDFILGIGSIVPHRIKGMSGGAKIMFPGVSGPDMMARNQWQASMQMSETVMGVPENPMRLRMEEAARIAGLSYIVNVIYDVHDHIVGCVSGDSVEAHRVGCLRSREVYAVHLPTRADIVLIDAHSADRDFWQSAKGVYAGSMAVRDGGSLILVAPNPEGVATNHHNVLKIGYRPQAELVAMVQEGGVDDLVGIAVLADVCQIVDHTDCIMVSPGVKPEDAARLGFRSAASAQEALAMAFERQGQNASVAVLRYGGHILPIVDDEAADRIADMTTATPARAAVGKDHT